MAGMFTVIRGDTWELPGPDDVFTLQVNGEPVVGLDDPGVEIAAHVRRSTATSGPLVLALTVVEVDLSAAQVRLTAAPAYTGLTLATYTYVFDIQVTDGSGRVTTFGAGAGEPFRLVVKGDVTRG